MGRRMLRGWSEWCTGICWIMIPSCITKDVQGTGSLENQNMLDIMLACLFPSCKFYCHEHHHEPSLSIHSIRHSTSAFQHCHSWVSVSAPSHTHSDSAPSSPFPSHSSSPVHGCGHMHDPFRGMAVRLQVLNRSLSRMNRRMIRRLIRRRPWVGGRYSKL